MHHNYRHADTCSVMCTFSMNTCLTNALNTPDASQSPKCRSPQTLNINSNKCLKNSIHITLK